MQQQLSWSREGETLLLSGELDQDLLNPLWDARNEAMKGVTLIDLSGVSGVWSLEIGVRSEASCQTAVSNSGFRG